VHSLEKPKILVVQSDDDEPKGNIVLNIHLDLPVMTYLHVNEVLMGLTIKQ
jgi:hypothetical protein